MHLEDIFKNFFNWPIIFLVLSSHGALRFGIVTANDLLKYIWLRSNQITTAFVVQRETNRRKICDVSFLFSSKETGALSSHHFMNNKFYITCPTLQWALLFFLDIFTDSFTILIVILGRSFIENILVLMEEEKVLF